MKPKETYSDMLSNEISRIYDATSGVMFSKNMAAKIVGGRRRLEELVGRGKIHVTKRTNHQHGIWKCRASDVLRNAYSEHQAD